MHLQMLVICVTSILVGECAYNWHVQIGKLWFIWFGNFNDCSLSWGLADDIFPIELDRPPTKNNSVVERKIDMDTDPDLVGNHPTLPSIADQISTLKKQRINLMYTKIVAITTL